MRKIKFISLTLLILFLFSLGISQTPLIKPVSIKWTDLKDVLITTVATGDVAYYDGTNWINLAIGSNGQILTLAAGVPSWAGGGGALPVSSAQYSALVANNAGGWVEDTGFKITSGNVTTGGWTGTIIAQLYGGTGIDTSGVTNGQLLIGNTAGNAFALASLTGTADQVNVALGASAITLSLPQSIAINSSVLFGGLSLDNGLVVNDDGTTGEVGIDLTSISSTFATLTQSDAEGIAVSSDTRLGLDETLRTFIIADKGDIATDFGLSASSQPNMSIYNAAADTRLFIKFNQITLDNEKFNLWTDATTVHNDPKVMMAFTLSATDLAAGNVNTFDSNANIELTDSNGQQSWLYLEPKVLQTGTAAFDGLYLNLNGTVAETYGDGSTGDGNNLFRLGDNGTTIYKFNLTGAYHFLETTTPTAVTNYGALYTKTDDMLYFQDGANAEHVVSTAGGLDVAVADGGTNIGVYAIGDLIYASATGILSRLADVAVGQYLASGGIGVAPAWATLNQAAVAGLTTGSSPVFVTTKLSGLTDGYVPYHVADATGLANSVIFTDGTGVGINTVTIPHGGVGWAKFAIDGTNASAAGPHVQFTTASDNYPLMQILNYAHDDMSIRFDSYWDGANKSSDVGSNYAIFKVSDVFKITYDSGVAKGAAIAWNTGISLNTSGQVGIGAVPTVNMDGLSIELGLLTLKERATPTADTNYGKIYTKTDNNLYFQDGAGNEHSVQLAAAEIAEMFMYESAGTITIDTTDEYHLMSGYSAGVLEGWTFDAGSTGPIASFATAGGNLINATDVGHGLVTGDEVSITGTAAPNDYNGVFTITKITDDIFQFTKAGFNLTTTATWTEGSYLEAGVDAAGEYLANLSITAAGVNAAKNWKFELFKNSTEVDHVATEMTPAGTNHQNCASSGFITIVAGDRIYVGLKNETDATDLELEHANVNLHRI